MGLDPYFNGIRIELGIERASSMGARLNPCFIGMVGMIMYNKSKSNKLI